MSISRAAAMRLQKRLRDWSRALVSLGDETGMKSPDSMFSSLTMSLTDIATAHDLERSHGVILGQSYLSPLNFLLKLSGFQVEYLSDLGRGKQAFKITLIKS